MGQAQRRPNGCKFGEPNFHNNNLHQWRRQVFLSPQTPIFSSVWHYNSRPTCSLSDQDVPTDSVLPRGWCSNVIHNNITTVYGLSVRVAVVFQHIHPADFIVYLQLLIQLDESTPSVDDVWWRLVRHSTFRIRWPQRVLPCIHFSGHAVPDPQPPLVWFLVSLHWMSSMTLIIQVSTLETHLIEIFWHAFGTNLTNISNAKLAIISQKTIKSVRYALAVSDRMAFAVMAWNGRIYLRFRAFYISVYGFINTIRMRYFAYTGNVDLALT